MAIKFYLEKAKTKMDSHQGLRVEIPRKILVDEVRRVAHELGKPPTMAEFSRYSRVANPHTCATKFHGWRQFLTQAGLNPDATTERTVNKELQQEFRRIHDMLGRTPTCGEFDKYKLTGCSRTIAARFGEGSYPEACKALGYLPCPTAGGWNKGKKGGGVDKLKLDEDKLRFMYDEEGLSARVIATKLKCSQRTVLLRLRRIGIQVRRHYYQPSAETTPESLLYAELERRRIPFMRQQPIDGLYVVDALIPGARIVIECDGDYWHALPDVQKRDKRKHAYLKSKGYHVLRFRESELQSSAEACVGTVEDEWDRIRPRRTKPNASEH
jgi:very-short-patch-repair endonuclease